MGDEPTPTARPSTERRPQGVPVRPSRAELGRRPLHRGLGTVTPMLLSLALHAGAAWGWWQVVIVTPAELDGIAPTSAHPDALPSLLTTLKPDKGEQMVCDGASIDWEWFDAVPQPSPGSVATSEALELRAPAPPRFTPPEFPAAELPDEPLLEPSVPFEPDVIWYDEPFEGMPAFAIRARRPEPVEAPPALPDGPGLPEPLAAAAPEPAPLATADPAVPASDAPEPTPLAAADPPAPTPDAPAPDEPSPDQPVPSTAGGDGGEVVSARPASDNRPPRYPSLARRRGWEGRVVLAVDLTAEGTVTAVRVARSCGHSVLDEAALEAVADWRFAPATRDGEAVADETEVSIRFSLTD